MHFYNTRLPGPYSASTVSPAGPSLGTELLPPLSYMISETTRSGGEYGCSGPFSKTLKGCSMKTFSGPAGKVDVGSWISSGGRCVR